MGPMLALRCPHCHAAAPIPLSAREELHCDSCGQRSELPEGARRQLEAADELLSRADPAKRKLSWTQAEGLLSAKTGRKGLWFLHGVFIFAALVWAAGSMAAMMDARGAWDAQALFVPIGLLPLATVVFAAWRGFSRLTARRQALAEKCAASPPAVPGAPLRCRVCAAPIQTRGTDKVGTCGYCGADNLVDAAVLARAVSRHKAQVEDLEAEVKAALTDVNAAARAAYVQALKSAFLAPLLGFGTCFVLVTVLWGIHLEADRSAEYAIVKDEGQRCIARIVEGARLEMRRGDGALEVVHRAFEPASALERADATRFIGRRLRDAAGKAWKVKEVKRTLSGNNIAVFEEEGAPAWSELEAFCLEDAP